MSEDDRWRYAVMMGEGMRRERVNIEVLRGKTLTDVRNVDDSQIIFKTSDGETYMLWHSEACCECVSVESIVGDLSDLIGSPLLEAEEVNSDNEPAPEGYHDSYTWTFYKLGTIKGCVTIRWLGTSNGYYSESVDFDKV